MNIGTFYPQLIQASQQENIALEKVIEKLVPLGLECVDIYTGDIRTQGAKYINKIKSDFGLITSSVFHYFVFDYKKDNGLEIAIEEAKEELERSAEVKSPFFMPVPVIKYIHKDENERRECQKIVLDYFANVSYQSKKFNITTVVENFSNTMSPYSYISDIEYILDNVPDIKYVLDTGNYWFGGTDLLKACEKFADKTVHVHLKDLSENENGKIDVCGRKADSVAIGEGMLPIEGALDILKNHGYNSSLIIEINSCDTVFAEMGKSFENLKKER